MGKQMIRILSSIHSVTFPRAVIFWLSNPRSIPAIPFCGKTFMNARVKNCSVWIHTNINCVARHGGGCADAE